MGYLEIDKFIETETRLVLSREWGGGSGKLLFTGYKVSDGR